MTLREALRKANTPVLPKLPERARIESERVRWSRKYEAAISPKALDPHALRLLFQNAIANGEWDAVSRRNWHSSVWIAFTGESPLAGSSEFADRLFSELRRQQRRSRYEPLVRVYLRDFDPKSGAIRKLAKELEGAAHHFDWSWRDRQQTHQIFNPIEGPRKVATACLLPEASPLRVLESLGIGGVRADGGFAAAAWRVAVETLQARMSRERPHFANLDQVLAWSTSDSGILRYPTCRSSLANALLLPWSQRNPDESIRQKISDFLLTHLKDPRLPVHSANWLEAEAAARVLRKWLTRVALEQFFQVVDQEADAGMWHYRRAFWSAYDSADAISDAWVLFGRRTLDHAQRAFEEVQSYGRIVDAQDRKQSVLLLRIGKLTIADWSHNGKCHIWVDGNRFAPKLYLPEYRRQDVIRNSNNDGEVHTSSSHGNWQRKVEEYIYQHTGVRLLQRQYMP